MDKSDKKALVSGGLFYLTGLVWVLCEVVFDCHFTICPSKLLYGMPCPGCGSTRALSLLMHGHPLAAATMNPNIYIILAATIGLPIALLHQIRTGKKTLLRFNEWLKRKSVILPLLILEIGIWIKNILMGI